jgi:hypothetical protein
MYFYWGKPCFVFYLNVIYRTERCRNTFYKLFDFDLLLSVLRSQFMPGNNFDVDLATTLLFLKE